MASPGVRRDGNGLGIVGVLSVEPLILEVEKNTTVPRCTRNEPPPYSCTFVRTSKPAGVMSTGEDQASPRTTTWRPPSEGRDSSHHTEPSSIHGSDSPTPAVVSMRASIGEGHVPYASSADVIAAAVPRSRASP